MGWPWKERLSLGIVGSLRGQILPAYWPNRWEVGDLALMKRRNCTTLLNTWVQNYFMGEWCKVLIFTAFIGGGLGSWKSNTTGSFSSFGTESDLSNCKNEFFILKCFWPPPSSPVLTHGSDSEPARRVPKYNCASLIRNNLLLQKPQINYYLVVCASSISIKNRFGIHSLHETINKKQKQKQKQKHLRLTLIVWIVF